MDVNQNRPNMDMYTIKRRKLLILGEVLKVDNEDTLKAVEAVLKSAKAKTPLKKTKPGISDFVGFLSKKEADIMKNIII